MFQESLKQNYHPNPDYFYIFKYQNLIFDTLFLQTLYNNKSF